MPTLAQHPLPWTWGDSGHERAGCHGMTGDCVCRAIAIATGLPYKCVYGDLAALGAQERGYRQRFGKLHPRTGILHSISLHSAGCGRPLCILVPACTVHLRRQPPHRGSDQRRDP